MDRHIKNPDLLEVKGVKEALKDGKVVVIEVAPTENPKYHFAFLAAEVEGIGSSSVNDAQALLLGFDGTVIIRCTQNMLKEQADKLKPGSNLNDTFGADFTIEVQEKYEPAFEKQEPRKTREGELRVCAMTGAPVYQHTTLTLRKDAKNETIKTVPEKEYKPVSTKRVLEEEVTP
jgi:hypothetical protein